MYSNDEQWGLTHSVFVFAIQHTSATWVVLALSDMSSVYVVTHGPSNVVSVLRWLMLLWCPWVGPGFDTARHLIMFTVPFQDVCGHSRPRRSVTVRFCRWFFFCCRFTQSMRVLHCQCLWWWTKALCLGLRHRLHALVSSVNHVCVLTL